MIVKLGDVIDKIVGDVDRFNTDLLYYVGGEHIASDRIIIYDKGILKSAKGQTLGYQFHYPFCSGDVLFMTKNPYLRKCGMVEFDGICSIATFVLRTKDESILSQQYLAVLTQSDAFWNYLEANKSGSVNYFITWKTLEKYEFDLPSIAEQERIYKAFFLIEKTKKTYEDLLIKTDALVKSRFIEMFGKINEFAYLEDCCTIHARVGWQALKKEEFLKTGNYMLITGTDFDDGKINYSTCVYISKERYDMDKNIQIQNGDILITKDGTIGKVAVVKDLAMPATLNAGIYVLRPTKNYNPDFFTYLFRSSIFTEFVDQVKSGSTIKHLNQGKLIKYKIPLVNIELQNQFASFYKQSDKSKFELQKGTKVLATIQQWNILH